MIAFFLSLFELQLLDNSLMHSHPKIYNCQPSPTKFILLIISLLLTITRQFQFSSLRISATPLTINQIATYQITMIRQLAADASTTPWNTQLVPAGSIISITFPQQYILTGSETCVFILINSNPATITSCNVVPVTRTVSFQGAVPSGIYISDIILSIGSVLNPTPALFTSPFSGVIGTDTSAIDSAATVGLQAASLASLDFTFDPATVNTTGSLIVTFVTTNKIPASGSVYVAFPSTLKWAKEASSGHYIPISGVMSCSALTNVKYSITCTGDAATSTVRAVNMFQSEIAEGTTISFTINQLFSPPTTQPADSLKVTTYSSSLAAPPTYPIDTLTSTISDLIPRDITSLLSLTTTASPIINSNFGLSFSWRLPDTLTKNDYFILKFPTGTVFNYIINFPIQLNLTAFTYNTTSLELKFYQIASSLDKSISTTVGFTILTYTAPSSVQTTPPFTLTVMNNQYMKMRGTATITTLPKQYVSTVSTQNTVVNAQTSYTIAFQLADSLSSSGYMIISIPSQLTVGTTYSITITGTSIRASPTSVMDLDGSGKTIFTVSNLNLTSSTIGPQSLSIKINGLVQPSSVKSISSFSVKIYYSSNNDLVAQAKNTNIITTTPGTIETASVSLSSYINSQQPVLYTFTVLVPNQIEASGTISITLPTQISILTTGTCTLNSVTLVSASCQISGQIIKFTSPTLISKQTSIILTYSTFRNYYSVKPLYIQTIITANSQSQKIDVLTTDSAKWPQVKTTTASSIVTATLVRGSKENSKGTIYSFNFTQIYAIIEASIVVKISFPQEITIAGDQLACTSGGVSATCTYASHYIQLVAASVSEASHQYQISITKGIYNPISMAPTTSMIIETFGKDSTSQYLYSKIGTGLTITNTFASLFNSLAFSFNNRILSSSTNLTLNFDFSTQPSEIALTDYFVMTPAASFDVTIDSSVTCTTSTAGLSPICLLEQNLSTNKVQLKITSASGFPSGAFNLNFESFITPDLIPSDFTSITSYSASDFIISRSTTLIKFTTYCTFPCKTCSVGFPDVCMSCYSEDLTNKIYLHQNLCLASCPSQYYQDTGNSICKQCLDPCFECDITSTNCTYCDLNSTYLYLNVTSVSPRTSTCLSQCPLYMYADITQIPYLCTPCISPCLACSDILVCESCIQNYFLYQSECLASCPPDVTVSIFLNGISQCQDCSPICETCQGSADSCTSCNNQTALYDGTCVSECPGSSTMVIQNSQCVPCFIGCKTCSILKDNCTSCNLDNQLYKYYYDFDCLGSCPDFYYPDFFGICKSCEALASRNCKNCSGTTVCLSCDVGFVFLSNNCLDETPDGYLNISGVAIPCQGDCQTCSFTLTNCTSCKTLNLFGNTCQETCPDSTIPLNQICQPCQFPCESCQLLTTRCITCIDSTNISIPEYYLTNYKCVEAADCPSETYPNQTLKVCSPCQSPCLQCQSDLQCLSCRAGFFYMAQSKSCQTSCPFGRVGINRVCAACQQPCQSCQISISTCLTCMPDLFYNAPTFQCLEICPQGISIANQTTMQCEKCESPCKTCYNTTSQCFSCITGYYLFEGECFTVCPDTFYGTSGICQFCINNCKTCKNATTCLSCPLNLYLYNSSCIEECPDTHALLPDGSNICTSCELNIKGCSNCTDTGQCYQCYSPYKYFESQCLDECPTNYVYNTEIFECVVRNQTDENLEQNLSNDNIFPMPFTVLTGVCIIAACMSKLQNKHTYLIGLIYSMMGLIQTLALGYLIFRYWQLGIDYYLYDEVSWLLLLVAGGIIYFLNIISFLIQTPLLIIDPAFQQWLSSPKSHNKCFFTGILAFSLIINYKFKMMPFTRLFKFFCMSAVLSSVTKFRVFNVFSFFGIIAQGLGLYVCFVALFDPTKLKQTISDTTQTTAPNFSTNLVMLYAFLDVIVIFLINIILAILVVWKKEDFFEEEQDDGYILQKKINMGGEDYSKQALQGQILDQKFLGANNYGEDSYGVLGRAPNIDIDEEESDDYSSMTNKEIIESKVMKNNTVSNIKVYFADNELDETSNPFRMMEKKEEAAGNIFSQLSQEDYQLSEHDPDQLGQSQAGGSEKMIVVNAPKRALSPKKKEVISAIVHHKSKASNAATDNEADGDVEKRISQRELELDELRKEMQERQLVRKQKRKGRKKIKKTIQIAKSSSESEKQQQPQVIDNNQIELSYEEISIKEGTSVHSNTIEDSKKVSTLQNNSQQIGGPELKQEEAQQTIDDAVPNNSRKKDNDDDEWIDVNKLNENRSQLHVFTNPSKQLQTYSRQEFYEKDQDSKYEEDHEEPHELQQQQRQDSISKSILMKKQTIKNSKFNDSKQLNFQSLEDGRLQYDKSIQAKSSSEHPELPIEYMQSLDKELLTENTKNKNGEILNENQKEVFMFEEESGEYDERGNTKMNYYNSLQSRQQLSPERTVSIGDKEAIMKKQQEIEQQRKAALKRKNQSIEEKHEKIEGVEIKIEDQNDKLGYDSKSSSEEQEGFERNRKYSIQNKQGQTFQDQSLEESTQRQQNERINQRPISAVKRNGNHEALLDVLQQREKDKYTTRRGIKNRRLPREEDTSPANKMFQKNKTSRKEQQQQNGQDESKPLQKSRVYLAGLRQVEQDNLKKKTVQNSVRVSQRDSQLELSSERLDSKMNQSRNKSFNIGPLRKYTSKDISMDEISFTNMQGLEGKYNEMLNPRYQGSGMSRQKPGSGGGPRPLPSGITSNRQFSSISKVRVSTNQYNNQDSLKKYYNYNLKQSKYNEDNELQLYYQKQKMQHSRSKDKSKNKHNSKQKQIIRQRSLQQTKRYKQLQKMYASKQK